jgi:hypothetical protein
MQSIYLKSSYLYIYKHALNMRTHLFVKVTLDTTKMFSNFNLIMFNLQILMIMLFINKHFLTL